MSDGFKNSHLPSLPLGELYSAGLFFLGSWIERISSLNIDSVHSGTKLFI